MRNIGNCLLYFLKAFLLLLALSFAFGVVVWLVKLLIFGSIALAAKVLIGIVILSVIITCAGLEDWYERK